MSLINVAGFVLILSVLVFIHELGHFWFARRSGIVAEEFGFGYPPRMLTLARGAGELLIGGRKIIVPRGFQLPDELSVHTPVIYETKPDRRGRPILTSLQVIEEGSPADPALLVAERQGG